LASGMPYTVASPQLAASPVHRGHGAVVPRREALILQAVLNHPWLLHDHLEDISGIEFRHTDAEKVKRALLDIAAHDDGTAASAQDGLGMREDLIRRGFASELTRIERAITTHSVWGARAEAGP